jgi:hypothetical protein
MFTEPLPSNGHAHHNSECSRHPVRNHAQEIRLPQDYTGHRSKTIEQVDIEITLQAFIHGVSDSNVVQVTGYPDGNSTWFSQFFQANARVVTSKLLRAYHM